MITIGKVKTAVIGDRIKLSSDIHIDSQVFELYVSVWGEENFKYVVADRADAFLFGVLPYAMRHGHDIQCEQPISGSLFFNLVEQYIPTLSKYDGNLYASRIIADRTDVEIVSEGKVATGLSCGVDCLHTVIQHHNNSFSKNLELTHFLIFNEGAFGGSYYSANRAFTVKNIHQREMALARQLNLPVINMATNLESLMKIPYDQFIVYAMGMMVMSISSLIGVYLYSSSGGDYGDFTVKNTSKTDISYADILTLHCISHGPTYFYSAGGSKTRFEKMKTIANHEITKEHLFSCLNYDFNCGVCPKCYRNLLTFDALGILDQYEKVYDIAFYKENRMDALEYLVREIVFHGYSYSYLLEIYNVIKKREPEVIGQIEIKMTVNKMIAERNYFKKIAAGRRKALRAYKTLVSQKEIVKVKEWFKVKNYKHIILYDYSYATDIFINFSNQFGVIIDYIVEDVSEKRMTPRLPIDTVEYPNTDCIIICSLDNVNIVYKKLKERTNIPIVQATEILDLRDAF